MQPIPLNEPQRRNPRGFALLALGFRPFFLLAGLAAATLVALWSWQFTTGTAPANHYGFIGWHSREMVFGYTLAVIAGFLLTAVRNWTGQATASGALLGSLALLWLLGRLLPWSSAPAGLVIVIDALFPLAVALALALPLLRSGQLRNYPFPIILLLLGSASVLSQPALAIDPEWQRGVLLGAVYLIMLLIAVMGGRVIPFFIEKGLPGASCRRWPLVDMLALGSLALLVVARVGYPEPVLLALLAAVAGTANAVRLVGWHQRGLWREPMLWVLWLGYAWLVVGLLLTATGVAPHLALHALTAGAIGVLTLGMMARVTLGHTGRVMQAPPWIPTAFLLANLAAALRVFPPLLLPGLDYRLWIALSAVAWFGAFGLFIIRYAPMLVRPRVDGQPG